MICTMVKDRRRTLTNKVKGLKDHQIQEMVNKIRDNVEPITNVQCLRSLINDAVMKYLEDNELRIDKKNNP